MAHTARRRPAHRAVKDKERAAHATATLTPAVGLAKPHGTTDRTLRTSTTPSEMSPTSTQDVAMECAAAPDLWTKNPGPCYSHITT